MTGTIWEYIDFYIPADKDVSKRCFDALGNSGFELVSLAVIHVEGASGTLAWFKRPARWAASERLKTREELIAELMGKRN